MSAVSEKDIEDFARELLSKAIRNCCYEEKALVSSAAQKAAAKVILSRWDFGFTAEDAAAVYNTSEDEGDFTTADDLLKWSIGRLVASGDYHESELRKDYRKLAIVRAFLIKAGFEFPFEEMFREEKANLAGS